MEDVGYAVVEFSGDVSDGSVETEEEELESPPPDCAPAQPQKDVDTAMLATRLAADLEGMPRAQWASMIQDALDSAKGSGLEGPAVKSRYEQQEKAKPREASAYSPGFGEDGSEEGDEACEEEEEEEEPAITYEFTSAGFIEETVSFSDDEEQSHSYATPHARERGEGSGAALGDDDCAPVGAKSPQEAEICEDWNTRFQAAMTRIHSLALDASDATKTFVHSQLSDLASDFVSSATVYGKIIIAELNTPLHLKTIRPASLGGLVGGDKYIVRGILFKFPESGDLYGEEAAAKVAKHELRGLSSLFLAGVPGVHFPMMALIDYLGFRLIAMTLLPLAGPSSLVYGSNDAGRTVHSDIDDESAEKLRTLASKLNLKPHMAGIGPRRALVYTPADLEGHIGKDGRLYLLDFSRTFPPESPKKGVQGSHLFRLLRAEHVRSNSVPLCSDAFSGFVMDKKEAVEHNREVHEATARLKEEVIPRVATTLNKLSEHGLKQYFRDSKMLVEVLHSNGINLRYIGLLRRRLRSEYLRAQVLIEMVARVVKLELRRKLRSAVRQLQFPSAHMNKRIVVRELNEVFGTLGSHWRLFILPRLEELYEGGLEEHEKAEGFDLRESIRSRVGLAPLLLRVARLAAVRCTESCLELASSPSSSMFECASPFDATDIESLEATVYHLPFVDSSTGFVLKAKAKRRRAEYGDKDPSFLHLCTAAVRKFELALYSEPHCPFTLTNYADTLYLLHKPRQAYSYFELALAASETSEVLLLFTIFLLNIGRYKEAANLMSRLLSEETALHCVKRILLETSTTGNVDAVRSQIRLACSRHGEGTLSRILGMLDTEASSTPALVRCGTRLADSFSEP